jgi:hypothetical protein
MSTRPDSDDADVRLDAIRDAALAQRFKSRVALRDHIDAQIGFDGTLLRPLIRRWRHDALAKSIEALIMEGIERQQAQQARSVAASAVSPRARRAQHRRMRAELHIIEPSAAERRAMRNDAAALYSKLDTFMINGRPLRRCIVSEALQWATSRSRDARFVRLVCAGMPLDAEVGTHAIEADVERYWDQVEQERRDAA